VAGNAFDPGNSLHRSSLFEPTSGEVRFSPLAKKQHWATMRTLAWIGVGCMGASPLAVVCNKGWLLQAVIVKGMM
jgi:hypothetical protein